MGRGVFRGVGGLFGWACALLFAGAGAFFVSGEVAAQEATVVYSAGPPGVVSLTADGYLIYKGKQRGTMTATVFAVAGTVNSGVFTARPVAATGMVFITLRGLNSCRISNPGCDAFGLENLSTPAERLASLIAMNLRTVTMFVASGANLDERVGGNLEHNFLLYHLATANKPMHIFAFVSAGADLNVRSGRNATPLHAAAIAGHTLAVSLLVSLGASVNVRNNTGWTPLHFSANHGSGLLITLLLSAGASVNATSNNGNTPFLVASGFGYTAAMTVLISAGASVNVTNGLGETPLRFVAASESTVLASLLLAEDADANAKDNSGKTPIFFAAANNRAAMITLLLGAGAGVNVEDDSGNRALDDAIAQNADAAIAALIDGGGLCGTSTDSRCPAGVGLTFLSPLNLTFVKGFAGTVSRVGADSGVVVGVGGFDFEFGGEGTLDLKFAGFPLFYRSAGMTLVGVDAGGYAFPRWSVGTRSIFSASSTPPEFCVTQWRWGRQIPTPPRKRRGV